MAWQVVGKSLVIIYKDTSVAFISDSDQIQVLDIKFNRQCTNIYLDSTVAEDGTEYLIVYDQTANHKLKYIHIISKTSYNTLAVIEDGSNRSFKGIYKHLIFMHKGSTLYIYNITTNKITPYNVSYLLIEINQSHCDIKHNDSLSRLVIRRRVIPSEEFVEIFEINAIELPITDSNEFHRLQSYTSRKIYDSNNSVIYTITASVKYGDCLYINIYRGDSLDEKDLVTQTGLITLQDGYYIIYKDVIYLLDTTCGSSGYYQVLDKKDGYVEHTASLNFDITGYKTWNNKLVDMHDGKLKIFDREVIYNIIPTKEMSLSKY